MLRTANASFNSATAGSYETQTSTHQLKYVHYSSQYALRLAHIAERFSCFRRQSFPANRRNNRRKTNRRRGFRSNPSGRRYGWKNFPRSAPDDRVWRRNQGERISRRRADYRDQRGQRCDGASAAQGILDRLELWAFKNGRELHLACAKTIRSGFADKRWKHRGGRRVGKPEGAYERGEIGVRESRRLSVSCRNQNQRRRHLIGEWHGHSACGNIRRPN